MQVSSPVQSFNRKRRDDVLPEASSQVQLKTSDMTPSRLTATSVFWRTRSPADEDTLIAESNDLGIFVARPLPSNTKTPLDILKGSPAEHVSLWLRKHGQACLLCGTAR